MGHDPRNTTVAICEWMHLRYEKHHVHGTGECRLQAAVEIESLPQGPFDVAGIDKDRLPGTVDLLLERTWSLVRPGDHERWVPPPQNIQSFVCIGGRPRLLHGPGNHHPGS